MERMILSLKSVYKILTSNDFPVYSESVIGKKNRKGQTLLRFWQTMLAEEFRSLPFGKMIWRNDGKRNRYISNLCNRSEDLKLYQEYAREIASQVSTVTLLNQIHRFADFLMERDYRDDILLRRIREGIHLLEEEDPCVTGEIREHIRQTLAAGGWVERYGIQGNLFRAGYLLTMLTLYAAAGEAMGDPALSVLRDPDYSMESLWEQRSRRVLQPDPQVRFLTAHVGLLQDNPLPADHFFGREEELFDLREMAIQGKKCMISGMGGIGKTEMLRQLIRRCGREHIVDKIAVIPYQAGIAESLDRAFPAFHQQDPEDTFRYILLQLCKEAREGKLLVLIDNLTNGTEEDPDLQKLQEIPCGVLITSRRSQLEGFEVYHLRQPSVTTGALIFRDNYGYPLTAENRRELAELLENPMLCHPLTLRLMARAAQSKNWTVAQLKENLLQNDVPLTWVEEERTVRLNRIYAQLYSANRIPEDCRKIAQVFTLLPLGSYSGAFLEKVFPVSFRGRKASLAGWRPLQRAAGWTATAAATPCIR